MNVLLVAMLAGLWLLLLSPGVLRDRRPRSPIASIDSFERLMDTLGPLSAMPAPPPGAPVRLRLRRRSAAERRRLVVSRLSAALAMGLLTATLIGGWTWTLPVVAGTLLTAYLVAWAVVRRQAKLRARVRHLPGVDVQAEAGHGSERRVQEA
jgi:hypothetical protein